MRCHGPHACSRDALPTNWQPPRCPMAQQPTSYPCRAALHVGTAAHRRQLQRGANRPVAVHPHRGPPQGHARARAVARCLVRGRGALWLWAHDSLLSRRLHAHTTTGGCMPAGARSGSLKRTTTPPAARTQPCRLLPEDNPHPTASGYGTYGGWAASGELDVVEMANEMREVRRCCADAGCGAGMGVGWLRRPCRAMLRRSLTHALPDTAAAPLAAWLLGCTGASCLCRHC